jgi:hypothetical protein
MNGKALLFKIPNVRRLIRKGKKRGFCLIARIYGELKKLNSPKINESIRKWTTDLSRTFSKEV